MTNGLATYKTENVVIYNSADNAVQLDVQLAEDTVWLTQQQMALLFEKDRTVITRHINNIFSDGELDKKKHQGKRPYRQKTTITKAILLSQND